MRPDGAGPSFGDVMDSTTGRARALIDEIGRLAVRHGRAAPEVLLVGIAKTRSAGEIRAAWEGGLRHVGENYLQEALPKIEALAGLGICWHFVGRIQSNKTAPIARHFDWVHALDRVRVAERLNEQRPAGMAPLQCCIEVRLSEEPGKGGVDPGGLEELAEAVSRLPRLRLRGLMGMPEPCTDPLAQRAPYARLARLLGELRRRWPGLDTLSMGMSGDAEAAIAEGATMVRIGTALFGERAAGD